MSYTRQNFEDGDVLTASHLNHIEDGLAAAELTPEQYGAVGDGVTNDAPAIVAAAKAACEQKVRLNLTRGKTYLWSDIDDEWSKGLDGLYMEGNGARLVSKDHRFRIFQMTNAVFHDIDFVGDPSSTAMELIQIFECTGISLLDCTLEWDLHNDIDTEHNILDIYRGNRDILLRGCIMKQLTGTKAGGIWIREGKKDFVGRNIRMENCDIYKAGADEVLAIWGWAGEIKDVTISGCNFVEAEDAKYAARGKDPAWFVALSADKEDNTVRFENCTVRTCRAGSLFKLGGNGNVTVDNCDLFNDSSNANHGYPLLHWNWGDGTQHCIIQNSRIRLKGKAGQRIAFRLPRCYNNQFVLDCKANGFQSSGEIIGNTFSGKMGGHLAQDAKIFSNNRLDLVATNPNWQSGCLNILNNDISLTIPGDSQGSNIIGNQPDGSTFAGNKITYTVNDSDIRVYGFSSGTHYVYNNQVYTNAPLKLENALSDVVFRKNNYINGLSEKSFACTGISFDPAELTENYMKRRELNAAVTPANTTDPIVYAISDPDGCFQILRYGAYKAVKDGKVSVKATCGSYDASQNITVALVPVPCESLRLGRRTINCAKDGTTSLRAVYAPYWTTDTISWESSAPDVATVDANGIVTGKALGTAVITVRCGSLSDSCTVSVVEAGTLPVYVEGAWEMDGKSFCIPLESIGTEHTLYVSITVDTTSLENGMTTPLFGTTMDGSDHLLTMQYMKDPQGYGTLRWATSDCSSTFDTGEQQNIYATRSVPLNPYDDTTASTTLIFTPEGTYNLTGALCWGCGVGKATLSAYSGKLYFNVADTAGTPTTLSGYKIRDFILFANETLTTEKEILQYRDSADIDIRFTEDGTVVNAGTAGAVTLLKSITPVEPEPEPEPEPTNTNPFPDVQAAYLLPNPKTFVPSKKEFIDTKLKLFQSISPRPSWTILFEAQCSENIQANMAGTFCLMHCMEEANPYPGLAVHIIASGQLNTNLYGAGASFCSTDDMSKLKAASKRMALRIEGDTWYRWDIYGNSGSSRSITNYTSAVDKSLILGAYQESNGTKGRFFDGTLNQCIVYNTALDVDSITKWVKGW